MDEIRKQLVEHLPPLFCGTAIDKLTGNALKWRTIQNIRANRNLPKKKRIPASCFVRHGTRKVLVVRDPFLDWWLGQLEFDCEQN